MTLFLVWAFLFAGPCSAEDVNNNPLGSCVGLEEGKTTKIPEEDFRPYFFWIGCEGSGPNEGELVSTKIVKRKGISGMIIDGTGMLGVSTPVLNCNSDSTIQILFRDPPAREIWVEIYQKSDDHPGHGVQSFTLPSFPTLCWKWGLPSGDYLLWISAEWGSVSTTRQYSIRIKS